MKQTTLLLDLLKTVPCKVFHTVDLQEILNHFTEYAHSLHAHRYTFIHNGTMLPDPISIHSLVFCCPYSDIIGYVFLVDTGDIKGYYINAEER